MFKALGGPIIAGILAVGFFASSAASAAAPAPALSAATAAATAAQTAPAPAKAPASAKGVTCYYVGACGSVYHVNAGITKRLGVMCGYFPITERYISKTNDSASYCGSKRGVLNIYVYANTELWCRTFVRGAPYWYKQFDSRGWHEWSDRWHKSCTYRSD